MGEPERARSSPSTNDAVDSAPEVAAPVPDSPRKTGLELFVHALVPGSSSGCGSLGDPVPSGDNQRPSVVSGCGVRAALQNHGPDPADVTLTARLVGGVAEYSRNRKTRAQATAMLGAGDRIHVDLTRPDWLRRAVPVEIIAEQTGSSLSGSDRANDPLSRHLTLARSTAISPDTDE